MKIWSINLLPHLSQKVTKGHKNYSSSSLFDLGRNNGSYNVMPELTIHHWSTEILLLDACVPADDIRVGQFAPSSALRWWFPQEKGGDDFILCSTTMARKLDPSGFHKRRDRCPDICVAWLDGFSMRGFELSLGDGCNFHPTFSQAFSIVSMFLNHIVILARWLLWKSLV